jgi:hypothetical protein
MKTDKNLLNVTLTRNQYYFASCWFNMVHEQSLDSYRVRAMNPRNALREVVRTYELGTVEERSAVRCEAHLLLERDPVLQTDPFKAVTARILPLLAPGGPVATGKEEGHQKTLLLYFVAELQDTIEAEYVQSSLSYLENLLVPQGSVGGPQCTIEANTLQEGAQPSASASTEPDRFEEIYAVTSRLLSALIDGKASLESLYKLYSEILVPRRPKTNYNFGRRFGLARVLLTQPASDHHVAFALDNVTAPESFPPLIGGITFSVHPPFSVAPTDPSTAAQVASKYLTPSPRRLFASKMVRSQDARAAGTEAAEAVGQILNLVRFEYERAKVSMPDAFAFVQVDKTGSGPRVFSLPAVVPNPSAGMDGDGLSLFVESVDELVLKGRFQQDGRDRVQSAFRLYRTGLDTNVLENKLVNWWTAIEYLVRGSSSSTGIGKSVETMLTPVLCNAYIAKHLHALRSALLDLGATLVDPVSGQKIVLRGMATDNVYQLFKRPDIQALVLGMLRQHIFAEQQFVHFFAGLNDPKLLHKRNEEHEQRLRWHLQRLWRARCDIVHSAERAVSAALLCANLEYYLKVTLMALLKALREVPTLSGPKEFFDRQTHSYQALQASLKSGSDTDLIRLLAN